MQPLLPEDPEAIGPYRLIARLGAGGMGRVYLARSAGGRTVAVKVVRPELAEDGDFRERFRREVEAARAVAGEFTAPVVDAGTDAAIPWLATSYVLGPSLSDVIEQHGALPPVTVQALGAGLAEALSVIHGVGLIHRDLKPSNVLLAADGPRVIDFGIARAADGDHLTSTGVVVGSPGFIPPEQATGQMPGAQGDVFSLGVVLAYAALGRQPFGEGTAAALLYQVVHEEPDLGGVDPQLRGLITALLAKDPGQRPLPAAISAHLAPQGLPSLLASWLPGPVASTIARHAGTILDTDAPLRQGGAPTGTGAGAGPEATMTTGGGAYTPTQVTAPTPAAPPAASPSPSRRRFLLMGAGAGVLAVGGGAAWALSGGGEEDKPDPKSTDQAPDPAAFKTPPAGTAPKMLWRTPVGKVSPNYSVSPQMIGGLLVVMGERVSAYDPVTGDRTWLAKDEASPDARLVASGGLIFLKSTAYDGDFVGLGAKGGKEAWRSRLGAKYANPSPIAADDRHVYLLADATGSGAPRTGVAAVDIKSRRVLWHEPRDKGTGLTTLDAVANSRYLAYADAPGPGDMYDLTVRSATSGRQVWTKKVDRNAGVPALAGDTLIIGGDTLRCFALKSGRKLWEVRSKQGNPFNSPVTVIDGVVYASVAKEGVWAVDARGGDVLWHSDETVQKVTPSRFVKAGGNLYGATHFDNGGVHALDPKTGRLRWT
ncbi:serine/threonine-protein kinase [Streptomyces boninensis]|uniref:serine/threonine-protein kinase n=1 Tax=Streptomyces boninensis TaxID=2039455 RepID=UPI003B22656D